MKEFTKEELYKISDEAARRYGEGIKDPTDAKATKFVRNISAMSVFVVDEYFKALNKSDK